ncbi:MAG TPA: hypothetical protein VGR78_04715, partial [Verrucomicrobiae bacterium]|nr:hypothetical protein [Verrucomicrobiae bacterium]
MDRKSLIILIASLLLLLAWYPLTNRIFPPKPAPPRTNSVANATNRSSAANKGATPILSAETISSTNSLPPITNAPPREERTLTLDGLDARYTFTSIGGGIKNIELIHFPANVGCSDKKKANTNEVITLDARAPTPIFSTTERGDANSLLAFTLTKTGQTVRAEAPMPNGLVLIKEFRLSTNYLLKATLRYENRSTNQVSLPERELVLGTAAPVSYRNESTYLGLEWFNGNGTAKITEPWFANKTLGCLPGTPRDMYRAGASNVFWGAVHNQFFTIISVPDSP